jgi:hypothetical protein
MKKGDQSMNGTNSPSGILSSVRTPRNSGTSIGAVAQSVAQRFAHAVA